MPQYSFQALDNSRQPIAGVIDAETVIEAISKLEARGLAVQSIVRLSDSSAEWGEISQVFTANAPPPVPTSFASPDEAGQNELRSLLAQVLERRLTIAPVLNAFSRELPRGNQRRDLQAVIRTLETGDIDQALQGFREQAPWWLPLFGDSTTAATPGAILDRYVSRVGAAYQRHRSGWLALAYPFALIAVVLGVLSVLAIVVVPIFESIYEMFGTQVPLSTRLLILFSGGLQSPLTIFLLLLLAAGIVFVLIVPDRLALGRRLPTRLLARLPRWIAPRRLRSLWIGRFATYLADLLDAGVTIPGALRVAALATERPATQSAARNLADEIETDSPFRDARGTNSLSATVVYALRASLPMPALVQLLREIGQCQFDRTISRGGFSAAIGPMTVIVVGLIVGWIVLALFHPLINLIQALA